MRGDSRGLANGSVEADHFGVRVNVGQSFVGEPNLPPLVIPEERHERGRLSHKRPLRIGGAGAAEGDKGSEDFGDLGGIRALEDVGVVRGVLARGIGRRDLEDAAELGEEERVVGPLGGADVGPAGDESGNGGFGRGRRGGPAAVRGSRRSRCAWKPLSPAAVPDRARSARREPIPFTPPPPQPAASSSFTAAINTSAENGFASTLAAPIAFAMCR